MKFKASLLATLAEMENEEGFRMDFYDLRLVFDVHKLIKSGKVNFRLEEGETGTFLVVDVPDELIKKYNDGGEL